MITKKLQDISVSDLQQLIDTGIAEGKTIEYKRALSVTTESEKKEFLADISSFANSNGGDLIFGIEAKDGIPTALTPLEISNIDGEVLRLENITRSGIYPKINFNLLPLQIEDNKYILIFRIRESWNKPHRIVLGGNGKFYARSSAGKYDLDVEELRQLFTLSDGIEKRMEDFRAERLIAIESENIIPPLTSKNVIVVHILPLSSFSSNMLIDQDILIALESESDLFEPMSSYGWHPPRINFEGIFSYVGTEVAHSYVQLFRNGSIELVDSSILDRRDGDIIPYKVFEFEIVKGVRRALHILKKIEINAPAYISLSLLNISGMRMSREIRGHFRDEHPIQQKNLILPSIFYDDFEKDAAKILQSSFDLIWNACGLPKSVDYDEAGNFLIKG